MEERLLTQPPAGKQGVRISKAKYDAVRQVVVELLRARGEMTFNDLEECVNQKLEDKFEGSIAWTYTTVKLDLEARRIIFALSLSSK